MENRQERKPLLKSLQIQNIDPQDTHLTEAYINFKQRITTDYLKCEDPAVHFETIRQELNMKSGTTTKEMMNLRWVVSVLSLGVGAIVYGIGWTRLEVKQNHFAFVKVSAGDYVRTEIFGPGYYVLPSLYYDVLGTYNFSERHNDNLIVSPVGDLTLAIVPQGTLKHFEYNGQNLILGPGIHAINDPLKFIKNIDLNSFYIEIGPEKWVTIPDPYVGIASNNGKIVILTGGKQHHLGHANFAFLKLVPMSIQTDRIVEDVTGYVKKLSTDPSAAMQAHDSSRYNATEFLKATTAEGQAVILDAMLIWQIEDPEKAINGMQLLVSQNQQHQQQASQQEHIRLASRNIDTLRENVLRIVKGRLANLVGQSTLTGGLSLSADVKQKSKKMEVEPVSSIIVSHEGESASFAILTFLQQNQNELLKLVNKDLAELGVQVNNINIYNAIPTKEVQKELDRQVTAKVQQTTALIEAEQKLQTTRIDLETTELEAQKKVKNAEQEKQAMIIRAEGQASSIKTIAEAHKQEGDLLNEGVARDLALMREAGNATKHFGKNTQVTMLLGQGVTIADAIGQTFLPGTKNSGQHSQQLPENPENNVIPSQNQ